MLRFWWYFFAGGAGVEVRPSAEWVAVPVPLEWVATITPLEWVAGMAELVRGPVKKSPGDADWRFVLNLSDLPQIRAGATVATLTSVTATGLTVSGSQIETGSKKVSALFSGGTNGTDYEAVFTLVLTTGETVVRYCPLLVRK